MVTIAFAYGVAFVLLKNYLMPEYVFMDYYQSHYPHLERRHAGGLIAFAVIKLFLVLAGTSFGLEWTTPFLVRGFLFRCTLYPKTGNIEEHLEQKGKLFDINSKNQP